MMCEMSDPIAHYPARARSCRQSALDCKGSVARTPRERAGPARPKARRSKDRWRRARTTKRRRAPRRSAPPSLLAKAKGPAKAKPGVKAAKVRPPRFRPTRPRPRPRSRSPERRGRRRSASKTTTSARNPRTAKAKNRAKPPRQENGKAAPTKPKAKRRVCQKTGAQRLAKPKPVRESRRAHGLPPRRRIAKAMETRAPRPPQIGRDWSATLFLPKTDFPMKAGLPEREPELLKRWEKLRLYDRLREEAMGRREVHPA